MNWADYFILAVIVISAVISLFRGFVREVISIVIWVAAFWLAVAFARPLAGFLSGYIASPTLQVGAAFALIFVVTLLLGAVVNYIAGMLVEQTGLSGTDRAIGVVFGAGRGLVIVGVLMLVVGLSSIPRDEAWWRESALLPRMQPWVCRLGVGEWMRDLVVYSPVAQGVSVSQGRPAADYWGDFCGGPAAASSN